MSLLSHLFELRKRLFRGALAILLGTVLGWFIADWFWDVLRVPITTIAEVRNATINYGGITSAFDLRLQVAIALGILVASPVWLYQVFAFIVPGLSGRERRYTVGFLVTAVPLFLAGCAAGWAVLPHIVELMTSFVPPEDASFVEAKSYLDFVLKLVLATGVAFVLPVFLVLLNFMRLLSARSIIAGWRWAVMSIAVFTAIATPAADVMSMFVLAVPMILLYVAAYGVAALHDHLLAKREALPVIRAQ